jgi:hypothetical protein
MINSNKKDGRIIYFEEDVDQRPERKVVTFEGIPVKRILQVADLLLKIGGSKSTEEETRTAILVYAREASLPVEDLQRVNDILQDNTHSAAAEQLLTTAVTNVTVRGMHLASKQTIMKTSCSANINYMSALSSISLFLSDCSYLLRIYGG